jgi:hypothetical protein
MLLFLVSVLVSKFRNDGVPDPNTFNKSKNLSEGFTASFFTVPAEFCSSFHTLGHVALHSPYIKSFKPTSYFVGTGKRGKGGRHTVDAPRTNYSGFSCSNFNEHYRILI